MSETVTTVSELLKDASPYAAISTGAGMTQVPFPWIQIIGFVIGSGGIFVGVLRWQESRRANDLKQMANDLNQTKWEHERAESINNEKAKTKIEVNSDN
jgi:biotin synthase-like enzyme